MFLECFPSVPQNDAVAGQAQLLIASFISGACGGARGHALRSSKSLQAIDPAFGSRAALSTVLSRSPVVVTRRFGRTLPAACPAFRDIPRDRPCSLRVDLYFVNRDTVCSHTLVGDNCLSIKVRRPVAPAAALLIFGSADLSSHSSAKAFLTSRLSGCQARGRRR